MSRGFQFCTRNGREEVPTNVPSRRTSFGRGMSVATNPVSPQPRSTIRDEIRNVYGDSHHISAAEDYVRELMMANTKSFKSHVQEKPKEIRNLMKNKHETPASEITSVDEKVNSWLQNCTLSDSSDVEPPEEVLEEDAARCGDLLGAMIADNGSTASRCPELKPQRSLNVEAVPFVPSPQWTPKPTARATERSPGPMDHLETPSASKGPVAEKPELKSFIFPIEKDSNTVILENLPMDCDEEVLRSLLEGFGEIGAMKIYKDNCGYSTAKIRLPQMEAAEWMVSCLDEMHFDGYGEPIRAKVLN